MSSEKVYVFSVDDDGSQRIVGAISRLARDGRATGVFGYAKSWLENPSGTSFPLDPERLPLTRGEFSTQKRSGLPGPIADVLPDRWGRRVIEVQRKGPVPSDLQLLLLTGQGGVGRLRFSATSRPPDATGEALQIHQIDAVADAFSKIERNEPVAPEMTALYAAGRSLGGARPKTTVRYDGALWIAKFERRDDEFDQCAAEHATMRLAAACGIEAAETRIIQTGTRKALLVRRFDRAGDNPSAHYLSALSALGLEDTSLGGGYPQIAGFLHRHSSSPTGDRRELYRRMIFNILVGNRDDHLKNHAVIQANARWRLSPAFDIVPQPELEPIQAISVGMFGGMATIENALSRAADFGLVREEAQVTVADLMRRVKSWRDDFRQWDVPDDTIRRLDRAFALVGVEGR